MIKKIIRSSYNHISKTYRTNQGHGPDTKNMMPWLQWVEKHIPKSSSVLELGCGMGVPVAKTLAKKHIYLGTDISDIQIERAKKLVPQGLFKRADMTTLRFPANSIHAVLSFYAIIHLPLKEQKPLLKRIYKWLKPGGVFAATLGHSAWTGRDKNWNGTEMFWSHTDWKTYRQWLKGIGFKIAQIKTIKEGKTAHSLFLCVKPKTD